MSVDLLRSRLGDVLNSKSEYIKWYLNPLSQQLEPVYIACKNEAIDNYICRDMNGAYFNFEKSQLLSYEDASQNICATDEANEHIANVIDSLLNGLIKTMAESSIPQPKRQWQSANEQANQKDGNLSDIYKDSVVLHKLESKSGWFFSKQISFKPTSDIEYHVDNSCKLMGLWVDRQYFGLKNLKVASQRAFFCFVFFFFSVVFICVHLCSFVFIYFSKYTILRNRIILY